MKCFKALPSQPSVASFRTNINPPIDHTMFYRCMKINYKNDRKDGDIIGSKMKLGNKIIYRGYMDKDVGCMSNCVSFWIMYKNSQVSVKLFDNYAQLCGIPDKLMESADEIVDLIEQQLELSEKLVENLCTHKEEINNNDYSNIPKSFLNSINLDDNIGDTKKDYLLIIIDECPNYLKSSKRNTDNSRFSVVTPTLTNYNYGIPFSLSLNCSLYESIFSKDENWQVLCNNQTSSSFQLIKIYGKSKITLTISATTGKVTQSGAISREYHLKTYEEFMKTLLINLEKIKCIPIEEMIVYNP